MVEKINRLIVFVKIRQILTICRHFTLPVLIFSFCILSFNATALSFISDDESESLVQNIVKPIFQTADIAFNPNKILIANDSTLNAFVSDGNYLVIHSGTLMNADNVNELNGILAHEAGHIAGGHIVRQKIRIGQAQIASVASLIAAGAAAAASGNAEAALAVMLGSQSSLLNSMTAYQMQEERSADESAVKYLKQLNQSSLGLKNFMQKSARTNRLNGYYDIPYFRTHPLNSERVAFFNQAVIRKFQPLNAVVRCTGSDCSITDQGGSLSRYLKCTVRKEKNERISCLNGNSSGKEGFSDRMYG